MNEWSFFCANGGNQSWQVWVSLRGNTMMSESKMAKFKNGRIQDGCHHQVKWEWMSLSQIELVWVSIRVEWECFWVNLREDNKVSESKMAVSQSNMAEFKMAAIIKLSQNEWVKFFCAKWWEPILASVSEFEEEKLLQDGIDGCIQDGLIQMAELWLPLQKWEWVWVRLRSIRVEWEFLSVR